MQSEMSRQSSEKASGLQRYFNFYREEEDGFEDDDDEDDDEFLTPDSSPGTPDQGQAKSLPPAVLVSPVETASKKSVSSVLESRLLEKVYDRYTVNLSDMQVLRWWFNPCGSSPVLSKFTLLT